MTDRPTSTGTSRRAFLAAALATATAAMVDPRSLAAARARAAALPTGELFPLGVASGDPTATGVVLWTRLVAPTGGDALPSDDVAVDWVVRDVATDALIASGTAPAVAALGHSVHVEVDGLDPDTWYRYSFSVDGRSSPVGRTRTFPGAGVAPAQVRFAIASCQNYSSGFYVAHEFLAAEDVDFVAFLGDYIYEKPSSGGVRPTPLPLAQDLATYRARYELYKADPHLQAAHHRFPWIVTMDDHEVANNVLGDYGPDGEAAGDPGAIAAYRARRADAFQAWFEHQPVRLPPPSGPDYVLHRVVEHSDLLRIYVLDGRQYRSLYPGGATAGPTNDEVFDESRTMLGAAQEAWLDDAFAATDARWNVIANQTVMSSTPFSTGSVAVYNFDQWDGYVAARQRLLRSLVANRVRNPLVVTGDIHVGGASSVRLDYEDPDAPDIAYEVIGTSISSSADAALVGLLEGSVSKLPWVRYVNGRQRGYAVVTLTAEGATADFRVVSTALEDTPAVSVATDFTDVIPDREPIELPVEPPTSTTTTTTTPSTDGPPAATPVPGSASYTG
ncbi:MAG: alkaline phosphatase D family protein [Acidimicrobiales bacterium]|nr:alkaline phosphatase D family protein [Acidimicrobiales bacterium]HRW38003.1 alkaline phosphatase D family protein [Aquihabitans sp.]